MTKSINTNYPTKDKYYLLGAYIILVQSTSGGEFCLYNGTSIILIVEIFGMIQYNHGMVIFGTLDKVIQIM